MTSIALQAAARLPRGIRAVSWIGIGLVDGIVVFVLLRQKLKRPEIVIDHP